MKPNKSIKENTVQPSSTKPGFAKPSPTKQIWTTAAPVVDENLPPSKTKLKIDADAQQALGVRLCELPKDKLLKLDLPEALFEAVMESKKIMANGAIRRHKQYLGRLMREIDTTPIEDQLARWDGKHHEENAYFHGLERWRNRMINDIKALDEFFALYPKTDIQQMRTLIRNAQKEAAANKPPKSSREIFKLIREYTQETKEAQDAKVLDDENYPDASLNFLE